MTLTTIPATNDEEGGGQSHKVAPPCHPNYLPLWQKPLARQFWVKTDYGYVSSLSLRKEHRAATPADLVFDLVFVVLLNRLGRSLRAEIDDNPVNAYRDFFALFIPIWFQWFNVVGFLNRFETKDFVFAVFFVLNLISMSFVGVSAERCGSAQIREECGDFAWSIAWNRLLLIIMVVYVLYHNWQYKKQTIFYLIPDCLTTFFWFLVGFMPAGEQCCDPNEEGCPLNSCWTPFIVCWWSAIFFDFFKASMPLWFFNLKLLKSREEIMAFNLPLLVERYELFVIISIGEVVAASLASQEVAGGHTASDDDHHRMLEGDGSDEFSKETYILVALIVLEAALIKMAYFDVAEHPCPTGKNGSKRQHALARKAKTGVAWVMLHMPLNAAIVIFGSIMEPLKLHGEFNQVYANSLSFSLALIVVIIGIFDLIHGGGREQLRRISKQKRTQFRCLLVVMLAVLPFVTDWTSSPLGFVASCNVITGIEVAFTFYSFHPKAIVEERRRKREGIK
eukprot:CAMPEP_0118656934 /NCGR_PEP_ID=MMETSP0785-20121206/13743_1 /TAXON_ID=91992 /ORGANISM="Bolidomonas pacifica, Strain CCMP 1866" /LENGTH=505 /DNA_ID=CAMNT_0006549805 /DNA_START=23 /DNA_END=1537 /DNA_ORIENTATION=+